MFPVALQKNKIVINNINLINSTFINCMFIQFLSNDFFLKLFQDSKYLTINLTNFNA